MNLDLEALLAQNEYHAYASDLLPSQPPSNQASERVEKTMPSMPFKPALYQK